MESINVSQEEIYNHNNITHDPDDSYSYDDGYYMAVRFIQHVVTCVIISVGLPLTLVAINSLRSMVKDGNVAPVYVINLLITDLLQFCSMIGREVAGQAMHGHRLTYIISRWIHLYCLSASIGFMVCISLERYLVIAWPLWYRFRRTIKISVVVCVLVWILPVLIYLIGLLSDFFTNPFVIIGIFLLLPLPLFIFFLVGTVKALSASRSVPSDEKRRIVGVLVLVLLIYLLLFLPGIIWFLKGGYHYTSLTLDDLSFMFVKLSPLADLFLYIFMKKGAIDKQLSSLCRCIMDSSDNISQSVEMTTP